MSLLRLAYKDTSFHLGPGLSPSLPDRLWGKPGACCELYPGEAHVARNECLLLTAMEDLWLLTATWVSSEADPPLAHKPGDDWRSRWHLEHDLVWDPEPQAPGESHLYGWPTETISGYKCCFRLLCLGKAFKKEKTNLWSQSFGFWPTPSPGVEIPGKWRDGRNYWQIRVKKCKKEDLCSVHHVSLWEDITLLDPHMPICGKGRWRLAVWHESAESH